MGNYISHKFPNFGGKLILLDGTIGQVNHPATVAEVMLEHSQHVVVEFCSSMAGRKLTPLPADMMLDVKKTYLILPMNRGKATTLSGCEARRILLKANTLLQSKELLSSTRILPLFARICTTSIKSENISNELEVLLESFDERPELLSRQFSGKMWKPSLDTIKEKAINKKFPRRFF